MRPFSIAALLGLVAVAALGFAALRDASEGSLQATFCLTFVALLLATLGALVGARPNGAWQGFAVFGWGYSLLAFLPGPFADAGFVLPTNEPIQRLSERLHPSPPLPPGVLASRSYDQAVLAIMTSPSGTDRAFVERFQANTAKVRASQTIAHLLVCWLFGLVGSILGRYLASRRDSRSRRLSLDSSS